MRTSIILSAVICAAAATFSTTATAAERNMTADACQPLTNDNLKACCADANWKELVLSDDARFCPPLSANDRDSGRRGDALATSTGSNGTTTPGGGGGSTDPDITGSIPGNPGNQMEVGGAGEKGKDNESPDKTGDRGNGN